MNDKESTIGLTDLLDEINRDLDELRKKHPGDYGIKNLTLWWELERERLVVRHGPARMIAKLKKIQSAKRLLLWFFAGSLSMIAIEAVSRIVFR